MDGRRIWTRGTDPGFSGADIHLFKARLFIFFILGLIPHLLAPVLEGE